MEFLHPPQEDHDLVNLLLVTSERGKTRIRRYEWDSSRNVSEAVDREQERRRVADDQQLPLLLIPLTISTSFLLVFEDRIVAYTNILTGHATSYIHVLDHYEDPEEPGISRAKPVFTQWARALRREDLFYMHDYIFLCREDGVVRFLEISDVLPNKIDSSHAAGLLKANVSTAFASLDLGRQFPDLLVAGGDMSDGGLWLFEPRKVLTRPLRKISNWTPAIDMAAANTSRHPRRALGPMNRSNERFEPQKRIFVPTGRGSNHGAITEVRLGIEASLLAETCEVERGLDQMWVLPDSLSGSIHFLLAYPTSTDFFSMHPADTMQDDDHDIPIDSEARTLTAGLSEEGVITQVTATSIRAFQNDNFARKVAIDLENKTILKATILRSTACGCLLLAAVKAEDEVSLRLACIHIDGDNIRVQGLGESRSLSTEPSCLSLQEFQGEVLAFVGSLSGTLQLFRRVNAGLYAMAVHSLGGEFEVCNSITMIHNSKNSYLVCGLRSGSVNTFRLDSHLQLIPQEQIILGDTPVSVIRDENNRERALLVCGLAFCALEYDTATSSKAKLTKIWISHRLQHDNSQEELVPIPQPGLRIPDGNWGFAEGHLFCNVGEYLHQVRFDDRTESRMLPSKINLDGTPSRVIYSEKLTRLIALYTTIVVRPPQRNGHHYRPGQRSLRPVFALLKPDTELSRPYNSGIRSTQVLHETVSKRPANIIPMQECESGEKILGMIEWFPYDASNKYHLLVVHTMLMHANNREPTGRLIFYSLSLDQNGDITMRCTKIMDHRAPVYAVATYDPTSLVYSCGNDVCLHTVDLSSGTPKWLPPISFSFRSRGSHISVHEHLIYVTTASESLSVLKIEETVNKEERKTRLVFHYSDEVARNGIYHLALPAKRLILTSSKDCVVAALWMPPSSRISNSLSTIFKTDLPGSITRFRQLKCPAGQTDNSDTNSVDGRLTDPILGSSTDGTFYQLYILDEPSWRLLRFIVNMAKRHPIICPFRNTYGRAAIDAPRPHIEPSAENKRHRHVDGDVLARVLEHGAEWVLKDMLERDPEDDDKFADFDSAEARRARFQQLMSDAQLGHGNLTTVVEWIRKLLASAL